MDSAPHQHALRRGRVSLGQHAYLVTTACRDRRRLFSDFETGCAAARAMTDGRVWDDATLLAWVLMPDHWHGLIALGSQRPLSQVVQRLKANSAQAIAATRTDKGSAWQPGFHDHAIRGERNLEAAARYIIANPLRAGLVSSIACYPFWDWKWGLDELELP
jgi:putative transposase